MEISISARHGNLGGETQTYIENKLPKLVHIFDRLTSITVTVDFQNSEPIVELLVAAEHKHDFVARERHTTVISAFDIAIGKMEAQLRKYKEKVQGHKGRSSFSGEGFGGIEET